MLPGLWLDCSISDGKLTTKNKWRQRNKWRPTYCLFKHLKVITDFLGIPLCAFYFCFLMDFIIGIKTNAPEMSIVSIKGPSIRSLPTNIR